MKKFILSFLFMATNSVAMPALSDVQVVPKALNSYSEIVHAITEGKDIRILFEPGHCTNADGTSVKRTIFAIGAFTPNEVIITHNKEIAASLTHLTMNDPHFPGRVVYQHVTYTISYDDNSLRVTSQVLDASLGKPLSEKYTYVCSLVKNGSAVVFAK